MTIILPERQKEVWIFQENPDCFHLLSPDWLCPHRTRFRNGKRDLRRKGVRLRTGLDLKDAVVFFHSAADAGESNAGVVGFGGVQLCAAAVENAVELVSKGNGDKVIDLMHLNVDAPLFRRNGAVCGNGVIPEVGENRRDVAVLQKFQRKIFDVRGNVNVRLLRLRDFLPHDNAENGVWCSESPGTGC